MKCLYQENIMDNNLKMRKLIPKTLIMLIIVMGFYIPGGMLQTVLAADSHHKLAKSEAENIRNKAAKALAEAQQAMVKADEMMRMAQKQKEASMAKEKDAFQKMVSAGYYPSDITLTAPNGKVHAVFSHRKHLLREHLKCTECHPRIFVMNASKEEKQTGFNMASMKSGHYCGSCHNGKKAFSVADLASCKRCHPRQL